MKGAQGRPRDYNRHGGQPSSWGNIRYVGSASREQSDKKWRPAVVLTVAALVALFVASPLDDILGIGLFKKYGRRFR